MIHEGYCLLIFLFFCEMKLYYVFNQPEPTVSLLHSVLYSLFREERGNEKTSRAGEEGLTTISNIDNPLKLQRQLNYTIFFIIISAYSVKKKQKDSQLFSKKYKS